MLALLLLFAADFAPQVESIPNRQPQLAVQGSQVALTFGAGDNIYFSSSDDGGSIWTKPVSVSSEGKLSLGMRRGPRIAISGSFVLISAIVGEKGRGADGDLVAWRSADGGKTWSAGKIVNDVPSSAREGLHAMAAGGNHTLFVSWLDLRDKGTRLYGSVSSDGGANWSANRLVYESPSGSVCECCHPTAFVDEKGRVFVMFRNSLDGNRDMYVVRSDDGGKTFGGAHKLGTGSWQLNGCPMDGGGLTVDPAGVATTVWRREGTVYRSGVGGTEDLVGPGRQPVVVSTSRGAVLAWTEGKTLKWARVGDETTHSMEGEASFLSLATSPTGDVLVAGERAGSIFVTALR